MVRSRVICRVAPFRVLITLLITYLLSPLGLSSRIPLKGSFRVPSRLPFRVPFSFFFFFFCGGSFKGIPLVFAGPCKGGVVRLLGLFFGFSRSLGLRVGSEELFAGVFT